LIEIFDSGTRKITKVLKHLFIRRFGIKRVIVNYSNSLRNLEAFFSIINSATTFDSSGWITEIKSL
jgi:hypothetical protein